MEENKNISLITLVWPLFIQSFLNLFMGNVNVLMLSRYSDDAVGAVGVANQIINIINVMYNVVGMGTAIIISQYIGAGKRYMASKIANLAIMVNFIFGLLLSMFLIFFCKTSTGSNEYTGRAFKICLAVHGYCGRSIFCPGINVYHVGYCPKLWIYEHSDVCFLGNERY